MKDFPEFVHCIAKASEACREGTFASFAFPSPSRALTNDCVTNVQVPEIELHPRHSALLVMEILSSLAYYADGKWIWSAEGVYHRRSRVLKENLSMATCQQVGEVQGPLSLLCSQPFEEVVSLIVYYPACHNYI